MYSLTKGNVAPTFPTVQASFPAGGNFYVFYFFFFSLFFFFFCVLTIKRPSISKTPPVPKSHATYKRKRIIGTVFFFENTHKRLLSDGQQNLASDIHTRCSNEELRQTVIIRFPVPVHATDSHSPLR